ncbi:hypothetical protein PROFUN_16692 [Planoprotostelium fungivorum]|uniref:Uncharacterized protein n=1 Tax=Planoprotostelium fungivorum TaxID=1890364 RepID=A0A2P6MP21_9EUKA|nr:hypothetical protein PROFUN_16692 [Planoprotostelium fungivorum]
MKAFTQTFVARINYKQQTVETLSDDLTWVTKWNFTVNSTPYKLETDQKPSSTVTQISSLGPYGVMFVVKNDTARTAYISQNGQDLVEFVFPRETVDDDLYPLAFNYLPTYDRVLFHHKDHYLMDKDMQLKKVNFNTDYSDNSDHSDDLETAEAKFIECDGQMWALGRNDRSGLIPECHLYNSVDGLNWTTIAIPNSNLRRGQIACVDNGRLALAAYNLFFTYGTASQKLGWLVSL